jgi:hypothetical protein
MVEAEELFDPESRARVRRRTQRSYAVAFGLTALVSAGLVGGLHTEEAPFLAYAFGHCAAGEPVWECDYPGALDWLAGGLALGILGLLCAFALCRRRIAPTVTCNGCRRQGWILDLESADGRCPRCGHGSFRYRGLEGTGVPVVRIWREDEIPGRDLLELARRQRLL